MRVAKATEQTVGFAKPATLAQQQCKCSLRFVAYRDLTI
jgi:hypothetical protein